MTRHHDRSGLRQPAPRVRRRVRSATSCATDEVSLRRLALCAGSPSQAPPVPVAFTLGARDVRDIGLTHARRPPVGIRPVPLGPSSEPALHYPLGDGSDPSALVALRHLAAHLRTGVPRADG
ncbi:DUF6177 family protein [Streptomyces werraensis]|uniref:DUF6177 family protein n=1 Tax=Streptomyces werraensis TaxID=68284 RepID=UPI00307D7A56